MGKDTVAGAVQEIGGKVRKNIGQATGDTEGEVRGAVDEIKGNVRKNIGKMEDAADDAANE